MYPCIVTEDHNRALISFKNMGNRPATWFGDSAATTSCINQMAVSIPRNKDLLFDSNGIHPLYFFIYFILFMWSISGDSGSG